MSDVPDPESGTVHDAPNQQVVRPDASAPWDEGTGGSEHPEAAPQTEAEKELAQEREAEEQREAEQVERTGVREQPDLDDMTKDELLAEANRRGLDVNAQMNKAEIREALGG